MSPFTDADLLEQILSQARSKQVMEIIRRALGDRVTVENFTIAGINYVRAEDRDTIPQAADFLLTEENIHTVIVYGIVVGADQQEKLIGSMRTSKTTLDPDEFLKDVFGKDEASHYFGGGKQLAGGFEIPIGFLSGDSGGEYREQKWQVYDSQIKHKLLKKNWGRKQVILQQRHRFNIHLPSLSDPCRADQGYMSYAFSTNHRIRHL